MGARGGGGSFVRLSSLKDCMVMCWLGRWSECMLFDLNLALLNSNTNTMEDVDAEG